MPAIKRAARKLAAVSRSTNINWHPGHMFSGMQAIIGKLNTVDCVVEVHDARIPLIGRNNEFRRHLGLIKPRVLVLNKVDLADLSRWEQVERRLEENDDTEVLLTSLKGDTFSHSQRGYDKLLNRVVSLLKSSDRFNRETMPDYNIMVVGIPNVGKSTLINRLRQHHLGIGGEASRTGKQAGVTKHVEHKIRICSRPLIYSLDTPGIFQPSATKNRDRAMKLALCSTINDKIIRPLDLAQYLLDYLNKSENYSYLELMGLKHPVKDVFDLCKRSTVGKQSRVIEGKPSNNHFDGVCWHLVRLFRQGFFGKVLFLS